MLVGTLWPAMEMRGGRMPQQLAMIQSFDREISRFAR
jgi:hypothetical protein